jgi:hypothetical protein
MRKTGSQVETDVYKVAQSVLEDTVRGGVYKNGYRPHNSKQEDAVVVFVSGLVDQVETGALKVNIYVPNVDFEGRQVKDGGRCTEMEAYDTVLLESLNETMPEYLFTLSGTTMAISADEIDQHFVNIQIKYKRITF